MKAPPRPPESLLDTAEALVRAVKEGPLDPRWRALYEAAAVQLFAAVGRGELASARQLRDALQGAEVFLDQHRWAPATPEVEAAAAVQGLLDLAHLGAEGLERPEIEQRALKLGGSTRAVLAVLRGAEAPLHRGEVHRRLPANRQPSPARVSQILEELTRLGFALRGRVAQGERLTGYYQLSHEGEELCGRLDVTAVKDDVAQLRSMKGAAQDRHGVRRPPELLASDMPTSLPWVVSA